MKKSNPKYNPEEERLRKIKAILDEPPLDKLKFVYKRKIKPNKRKPDPTQIAKR